MTRLSKGKGLMGWEEKFDKIRELGLFASLQKDVHGLWCVTMPGVEIERDGMLTSGAGQHRKTIADAVDSMWDELAYADGRLSRIIVNGFSENRREYCWKGHEGGVAARGHRRRGGNP